MIRIHGARQNNLRNVEVTIPRGKLTVVTGVSGSGKSSLAFDTLYAEGQRRYVESFSTYARQFLERMDRPDVDRIDGLLPAVALEQKNTIRSSRATLGTLTELTDYLKVLFARLAAVYCPTCGERVEPDLPSEAAARALAADPDRRALVTFPFNAGLGQDAALATRFLMQQGYQRVLRDGAVVTLEGSDAVLRGAEEVVVDRLVLRADARARLIESLETAYRLSDGVAHLYVDRGEADGLHRIVLHRDRQHCGHTFDAPSEGLFSFSSPLGACETCNGFGRSLDIDMDRVVPDPRLSLKQGAIEPWSTPARGDERRELAEACLAAGISLTVPFEALSAPERAFILEGRSTVHPKVKGWGGVRGWFRWLEQKTYKMHVRIFISRFRAYMPCTACGGARFKSSVRQWRLHDRTLPDVLALTVQDAHAWVRTLPDSARTRALAPVTTQLADRLGYLDQVGLGYLTLDRQARTLSGGEVQRANLTTTLGSGLVNTLFVLDEPTVGLHAADSERLGSVLADLVHRDNTVVVVEHDPDLLRVADHLVELGPGPGDHGGTVVFQGPVAAFHGVPNSPTAAALAHLSQPRSLAPPTVRRKLAPELVIRGASAWNLKGFDVHFPLNALSVVTGVSGSGKSTLVGDVLYRGIQRRSGLATDPPGACEGIDGLDAFLDVRWIDQSPPQASSRANPVTYIGVWDFFRTALARTDEARARHYTPSTFSFNTGLGRCPACEGSGVETVEMQFLADVHLTCEVCEGRRFKAEVLDITWNGLSVADLLAQTVDQIVPLMPPDLKATASLKSLQEVGLGYLRLGQPLSTLSGGEAQRLKLAEHLAPRSSRILFLLDEPTTGLHLQDVARLIAVLQRLVREGGHTVICVEHHLELIAAADHVVDLGPGGGVHGGQLLFAGPPSALVAEDSQTGRHLRRWIGGIAPLARSEVAEAAVSYDSRTDGSIIIEGARTHNLKNVNVTLPRTGRTVISGVSGSGKSTLAFDLIFSEGQRRFLDCLSAYARQFIEQLARPDADRIEGIPPTVAIEQRMTRGGARSNVANVTEIEPFLRIVWARLGTLGGAQLSGGLTVSALVAHWRNAAPRTPLEVSAPVVQARQGFHLDVLGRARREGYRVRIDGALVELTTLPRLRKKQHHDIDFIIGAALPTASDFADLIETAAELGKGEVRVGPAEAPAKLFQLVGLGLALDAHRAGSGFDPRYFSPRTALGQCDVCEGWGSDDDGVTCGACGGSRLGPIGRSVTFGGKTFPDVLALSAPELVGFLEGLTLSARARAIAEGPFKAIRERVEFLTEVGLGYLQLARPIRSLSGGEAQRIRLASQLGAHLSGVLYVLDEPTIGLHPTDTQQLLATLDRLQARGNGILMVEHDEMTLRTADVLIDVGPGAGVEGGEILAQGPLALALANPRSVTGRCLASPRDKIRESPRSLEDVGWISLDDIHHNSLNGVAVRVPRGRLTVVTGVSGSGKSSLVDVLKQALAGDGAPGEARWSHAEGLDGLTSLVAIDDQPIGKNPRSTPATYVGLWDDIRSLFAALPEAKVRGYERGRFSFNVKGGRCEACAGAGNVKLEMSFLPDAYVACGVCHGTRYAPQTLQVQWDGHSIHDILELPVRDALRVFDRVARIKDKLTMLDEVGLGYLTLGQGSPTLSGGEAQRIKLVTHLAGRGQAKTVLILDEPSIGLHMADIPKLIKVLHQLVDKGATVIVVEHNPDLMREADWLIDMGPGAGAAGGQVVYAGPYAGLVGLARSRTGAYLGTLPT